MLLLIILHPQRLCPRSFASNEISCVAVHRVALGVIAAFDLARLAWTVNYQNPSFLDSFTNYKP